MNAIELIPFPKLALAFLPVAIVIVILWKWKTGFKNSIYAMARMVIQLLLIGYALTFIFGTQSSWMVLAVLSVMLLSASWISLRTIEMKRIHLISKSFIAILVGGGSILFVITQGVLELQPWHLAHYMISLAGMIFANAMNSISLAGERLQSEISRNEPYEKARLTAFQASLIPITNSLFAVGLVSLPGMMTGQILSGVSPFIAVRYQIMVMCMMFGSAGISSAIFLHLVRPHFEKDKST